MKYSRSEVVCQPRSEGLGMRLVVCMCRIMRLALISSFLNCSGAAKEEIYFKAAFEEHS